MITQAIPFDISSLQRAVASTPVQQGLAVVFAFGESRGNPGPAGAGVVVAIDGRVVESLSKSCGVTDDDVAAYTGLLMGLERARELDVSRIEVRMDSELVVKQMLGMYRVKNDRLIPFFQHACALAKRFEDFKIIQVPSEFNKDASRLANQAIDRSFGAIASLS